MIICGDVFQNALPKRSLDFRQKKLFERTKKKITEQQNGGILDANKHAELEDKLNEILNIKRTKEVKYNTLKEKSKYAAKIIAGARSRYFQTRLDDAIKYPEQVFQIFNSLLRKEERHDNPDADTDLAVTYAQFGFG